MKREDLQEMAAALVLGTLRGADRSRALALEQSEPEFKRAVAGIERSLAPLLDILDKEAPPSDQFAAIEARIDHARATLPGTFTMRAGSYDWQPLAEGVDAAMLWHNEKAKRQSMLIRMQPGAHYKSHEHDDDEECFVIEGDLVFGELRLKAGDFHLAPRGRTHPPAYSPSGCLLYITAAAA